MEQPRTFSDFFGRVSRNKFSPSEAIWAQALQTPFDLSLRRTVDIMVRGRCAASSGPEPATKRVKAETAPLPVDDIIIDSSSQEEAPKATLLDGMHESDDEQQPFPDVGQLDVPAGQPNPRTPRQLEPATGTHASPETSVPLSPTLAPLTTAASSPGGTSLNDVEGFMESASLAQVDEANVEDFEGLLQQEMERKKSSKGSTEAAGGEVLEGNDQKLIEAATSGKFDTRDAVGQRFSKEHKPGSKAHQQYNLMKTRAEKAAFREDWAKKTFAHVLSGKTFTESYTSIDKSKGTYETFGGIVISFGGWSWQPAVLGAKKHCTRCVAMGGDWCYRDHSSGLMFYFLLKKEWEGIFAAKWATFEQHASDPTGASSSAVGEAASVAVTPAASTAAVGAAAAAAASASVSAGGGAKTAAAVSKAASAAAAKEKQEAARAAGKSGGKAKAKAKTKGAVASAEGTSPGKSPGPQNNEEFLKEALRVKAMIQKHKLAAETLLTKIRTDVAWDWARTDKSEGSLGRFIAALVGAMTPVHHDLMFMDAKVVKGKMTEAKFEESIECFVQLRPLIDAVASKTASLLSMHPHATA